MAERMDLLANGCLYVPSDEALQFLFHKIERPRPWCFIHMFESSFFPTTGACPSLLSGKKATSLGNATVTACDSGLLDKRGGCMPAVELGRTGAPLNVTVLKLDGFVTLPPQWGEMMEGTATPRLANPGPVKVKRISTKASLLPRIGAIPVHYYLCGAANSPIFQDISWQTLVDQTEVLNSGFAGTDTCSGRMAYTPQRFNTGIEFAMGAMLTIEEPLCDTNCRSVISSLRQGPLRQELFLAKVLICRGLNYLGEVTAFPGESWNRLTVILAGTVPGGDEKYYDLGKTLTHEMGHYLGLYHTFELNLFTGCFFGDEVLDTHNELLPASGCPGIFLRRTCDLTIDPWHNFMDYSDDSCMCSFTHGQQLRMSFQTLLWQLDLWLITAIHAILSLVCCGFY